MERYSDFAPTLNGRFVGERIRVEEVLNKDLILLDFEIRPSKIEENKGRDCLYMQIEFEKRKRVLITGSAVLIDQCTKAKDHIPFLTKIARGEGKNKRFLHLS